MKADAYLIHFTDPEQTYPLEMQKGKLVICNAPADLSWQSVLDNCRDFGFILSQRASADRFRPYVTELFAHQMHQVMTCVMPKKRKVVDLSAWL